MGLRHPVSVFALAGLLERWPQVRRIWSTLGLLPSYIFVSTKKNSMNCFIKWILLRIHVRSRNAHPCLEILIFSTSRLKNLEFFF